MPNPKKRAEKADAASAKKQAAASAQKEIEEDAKWSQGAKKSGKKESEAEKKAAAAAKKAEKARLEAEEDASLPSKPKGKVTGGDKVAAKRTNKVDDFLKEDTKAPSLAASNVNDALDLLSLDSKGKGTAVERHPERRFKAAFNAYKDSRLSGLKTERPGLRSNQYEDVMYKEFQKHPSNPFNQVTVAHNASREEIQNVMQSQKDATEKRLASK